MIDRNIAVRQPWVAPSWVATLGPTNPAMPNAPTICMKPMLNPRHFGALFLRISVWLIGIIGPSARPRVKRVSNSTANDSARPLAPESSEKRSVAVTRKAFSLPERSASWLPKKLESAIANDSPAASQPTCALLSPISLTMNGARKATVCRSKPMIPLPSVSTNSRPSI